MYKNKDTGSLGITNSFQQKQSCCDNYTIMQKKKTEVKIKIEINRNQGTNRHTVSHTIKINLKKI